MKEFWGGFMGMTLTLGVAPQGELKRALQDLNAKTATAPVN